MHNGQEEGRGLAAACDCVGQEVPAFEGVGDALRLDWGGAYEAQILDTSKEGRVQLEVRKSQNNVRFLGAQQAGRNIRLDRLAQSHERVLPPEPRAQGGNPAERKVTEELGRRQGEGAVAGAVRASPRKVRPEDTTL